VSQVAIILDERASWLSGCEKNVTSQFGEDGLIAATLARFGMVNRWCFEVGANDGLFYSNTKTLRDNGWDSVLIEAGEEHYQKLIRFADAKTRCIHAKIGPDSLDAILSDCIAPVDLDFGCIDIDGQDYWCWDGMKLYCPRVMLVEYARSDESVIPALGDESPRQATLKPIIELGKRKGYDALAATYCNVLFVRSDLWPN